RRSQEGAQARVTEPYLPYLDIFTSFPNLCDLPSRKRDSRRRCDSGRFQLYSGIRVNPTTLMHEPEERAKRFELLARGNILVFPGSAEPAHPVNVEVRDKGEPTCRSEVLQLTE
ncbi:MAG TPA: hypothetical protein VJ255_01320, partial [Candidatus Acidoferrum sp.]|nr:hypothetical protein [Candidatus Acidoferrum sp.]